MNRESLSKPKASKTIEELLDDVDTPHNQNWLLSYLDVFVLMVMLVITLISLGELKIEETPSSNPPEKTRPLKPTRPPVQKKQAIPVPTPIPEPVPTSPSAPVPVSAPPFQPELVELSTAINERPIKPNTNLQTVPLPLAPPIAIQPIDIEQKPELSPATTPEPEPEPEVIPSPVAQDEPAPTPQKSLEHNLTDKLAKLGLDQAIALKITGDYAQLEIQDKILFESSQADLTGSGSALLNNLAPLLKQASGLIFIEGHTDNRPIKTTQFPSNWELGSARATSVLHYLASQGLDSNRMRAMTYADTMPIADNSSAEGREKNRRVNILIKVQEQDVKP